MRERIIVHMINFVRKIAEITVHQHLKTHEMMIIINKILFDIKFLLNIKHKIIPRGSIIE